jgi:hypothetical protein
VCVGGCDMRGGRGGRNVVCESTRGRVDLSALPQDEVWLQATSSQVGCVKAPFWGVQCEGREGRLQWCVAEGGWQHEGRERGAVMGSGCHTVCECTRGSGDLGALSQDEVMAAGDELPGWLQVKGGGG